MSAESDERDRDAVGSITTFVYDASGRFLSQEGPRVVLPQTDSWDNGKSVAPSGDIDKPAAPKAATRPAEPCFTATVEFRLAGSESAEQCVPLAGLAAQDYLVATQRVSADVTRSAESAGPGSPIGGLEVFAELRDAGIVCTARLSEFSPQDLVVIRVEVALYRR